jgi:hypothetical protein
MRPNFRWVRVGKKSLSNEEILLCPYRFQDLNPLGKGRDVGILDIHILQKMVGKDTSEKKHECLGKILNGKVRAWK